MPTFISLAIVRVRRVLQVHADCVSGPIPLSPELLQGGVSHGEEGGVRDVGVGASGHQDLEDTFPEQSRL